MLQKPLYEVNRNMKKGGRNTKKIENNRKFICIYIEKNTQ